MKKILKYILILVLLSIVGVIAYALLNSGEDNGKRKAIEATKIDWTLLVENDSVPGVLEIKVDNEEIYIKTSLVEELIKENKKNIRRYEKEEELFNNR